MKNSYALLLMVMLIFAFCHANSAQLKVAVIDDGLSEEAQLELSELLCKNGHYDFAAGEDKIGLTESGHGDLTTLGVAANANTKNMCILSYKTATGMDIGYAIDKAVKFGAKVISVSVYSTTFIQSLDDAVKRADNAGVKIFVAAGNDKQNLDLYCNIFPQCLKHKNIVNIGAVNFENQLEIYSNFGTGKVHYYKLGRTLGGNRGTSFAAPAAAGQYIKNLNLDKTND